MRIHNVDYAAVARCQSVCRSVCYTCNV